jgi:multiple sugar transport system ATP-binding protein
VFDALGTYIFLLKASPFNSTPQSPEAPIMAEVKLEGVSKIYDGKVTAVRDVDFTINDKEFVVLVGPSGCGKSTVLRMIAGLEEITAGTVSIDGKVVNDVAPKDRDIAMVFQNYALYPHMTVYDNLAFGLKLRKYPKAEIEQRVHAAADILGIASYLERKPKALSGGQRQRVALGRAIVRQPKVFLFDEPLSNLDANLRVQMRTEISRLHHQLRTTMIYVTHDQIEAMSMGDRIVVMKDGVVQQVDAPLKIYHRPVNKFVAGFIGSPTMNFLSGKIERNGAWKFRQEGTSLTLPIPDSAVRNAGGTPPPLVTLGIRPEHISAVRPTSQDAASFNATIEVVEPVGNESFVHFSTGGATHYVARIASDTTPRIGASCELFVDTSKMHLFDSSNDRSI